MTLNCILVMGFMILALSGLRSQKGCLALLFMIVAVAFAGIPPTADEACNLGGTGYRCFDRVYIPLFGASIAGGLIGYLLGSAMEWVEHRVFHEGQ